MLYTYVYLCKHKLSNFPKLSLMFASGYIYIRIYIHVYTRATNFYFLIIVELG